MRVQITQLMVCSRKCGEAARKRLSKKCCTLSNHIDLLHFQQKHNIVSQLSIFINKIYLKGDSDITQKQCLTIPVLFHIEEGCLLKVLQENIIIH